ncbi:MAG TPA: DUF998 domain-containing protein [Nakamurella sp.]
MPSSATRTRRLLTCGAVAGPLFVAVTTINATTRAGFDIRRHGLSLLSLGDRGWIQVANFVVAGALSIGFGVGVRRLLGRGVAPPLIWGYGAGLIVTGVFLVDPGAGFPAGAPADVTPTSWHGAIHAVAPPFAFACLAGLCVGFASWFARRGRAGWAAYSLLTALAALLLIFLPGGAGSVRSALAVVLTSAWLTGLAVVLRREVPDGAETRFADQSRAAPGVSGAQTRI